MDNLTHGLTGAGIGFLVSQNIFGVAVEPTVVMTAIMASQIPDMDVMVGVRNKTRYLKHHRGFSHSVFIAPVVSGLLALGMSFLTDTHFIGLFLAAYLSLMLHITLDIFNAYGTKALWPISQERFAWDVLMVVDPIIIVGFSIGIGLYLLGMERVLYLFYPALLIYILSMVKHRLKAKKLMMNHLAVREKDVAIMPPMVGWRTWNYIALKGEEYQLGKINIAHDNVRIVETLPVPNTCEKAEDSLKDPRVQTFLDFARFPYYATYKTETGDYYVRWSDLRYKLREKEHFTLWCKAE